ncbi:MAG: carotenoid oxygenase family protein [Bacteroidota bacterium]
MQKIVQASRKELDLELQFVDGYSAQDLPTDLSGHVFINSAVGSINSEGLPYKKYRTPEDEANGKMFQEYGSPMLNGDSMILRLDFDETEIGKVKYKSRILKQPCYYADEATKIGGPALLNKNYRKFGFKNMGFGRVSMKVGSRNQTNTAIVPIKYPGEENTRLLATIDAGRPWEFDPVTLKLRTGIGPLVDWESTMPLFAKRPFPTLFASAHPVFDAKTREFFSVNFVKSSKQMYSSIHLRNKAAQYPAYTMSALKELKPKFAAAEGHEAKKKVISDFESDFHNIIRKKMSIGEVLIAFLQYLWLQFKKWLHKEFTNEAEFHLLCWDGLSGQLKKWNVVGEDQQPLPISQIVHQMSVTEDYIIFMNSAFKFSMDQGFTFPIESNHKMWLELDQWIREHTTVQQIPYTDCFIIKRSDLEKSDTVVAKTVTLENACLHYNADYANPDGKITLYTADNNANCAAEWVRPYDTLAPADPETEPPLPLDENWLSFFAIGNMDLCKVGKYVIDAEKASIEESIHTHELGDMDQPEAVGPHTWGVALHTYRDIISGDTPAANVKNIYWQNMGLFPETLTSFIYELYKDYGHKRLVKPQDVAKYTQRKIPSVIIRTQTDDMSIQDTYQFASTDYQMRSIQFVNRKRDTIPAGLDLSTDGYLVITMLVKTDTNDPNSWVPQIWILDAADLSKGPICKLWHPELDYCFPLHSAWLPEIASPTTGYKINVEEDYNAMIDITMKRRPRKRRRLQAFFEEFVYPNFRE